MYSDPATLAWQCHSNLYIYNNNNNNNYDEQIWTAADEPTWCSVHMMPFVLYTKVDVRCDKLTRVVVQTKGLFTMDRVHCHVTSCSPVAAWHCMSTHSHWIRCIARPMWMNLEVTTRVIIDVLWQNVSKSSVRDEVPTNYHYFSTYPSLFETQCRVSWRKPCVKNQLNPFSCVDSDRALRTCDRQRSIAYTALA